jgi:hypothetical protein
MWKEVAVATFRYCPVVYVWKLMITTGMLKIVGFLARI